MAHIFKHPIGNSKGIVIFTHKEINYFVKYWKNTRWSTFNKLQEKYWSRAQLKEKYAKHFNKIKKKYYLGVHFGWKHDNYPTLPFIDFYMSGKSTVSFQNPQEVFHIPMCSRDFIPTYFTKTETTKFWDIIWVARAIKFKNLDKFLMALKKVMTIRPETKTVVIIPPTKNNKNNYSDLITDFDKLFSATEKQKITLIKLSDDLSALGMPQQSLVHFYNASKVFTLFSEKEGESRVIAEALLCGNKVVVKSDLEGGGRDFLNKENSYLFDTFTQAHETLIKAIENYKTTNESWNFAVTNLREDYSIEKLKNYFEQLYKHNKDYFKGDLINTSRLDLRLPAHYDDVPWNISRFQTSDILSAKQFDQFISQLSC